MLFCFCFLLYLDRFCKPYKSGNKYCQVCVSECYQILKAKRSGQNILNKKEGIFPLMQTQTNLQTYSCEKTTTTTTKL